MLKSIGLQLGFRTDPLFYLSLRILSSGSSSTKKHDKKLIRMALKRTKTSLFVAVVSCSLSSCCEGAFQKVLSKGSKGR